MSGRQVAAASFGAALSLLGARLVGQEPAEAPLPETAAERERGEILLQRHGERSLPVKVLVADYVQRRTTELSKRPLFSRGTFLFVKKPACVVFRAREPRVSVVRLTAERYEVFRPGRKQLQRFVLDGPELAQGLFAALGGDVKRLLQDFDVRGCQAVAPRVAEKSAEPKGRTPAPVPPPVAAPPTTELRQVRLVPKRAGLEKRLRELLVTLRVSDAQLAAVAYRDVAGDLVEIELSALRVNPDKPPSVDFDVPKDTKVVEYAARPASGGGR